MFDELRKLSREKLKLFERVPKMVRMNMRSRLGRVCCIIIWRYTTSPFSEISCSISIKRGLGSHKISKLV